MPGTTNIPHWKSQPLLRFMVPFFVGLSWVPPLSSTVLLISFWIAWIALTFLNRFKLQRAKARHLSALSLLILIWLCGIQLKHQEFNSSFKEKEYRYVVLEVMPEPVFRNEKHRFDALVKAHKDQNTWKRTRELIRVNARSDSNQNIKTGSVLLAKIKPELPPAAMLPGTFCMKSWLADRDIRFTAQLSRDDWLMTPQTTNWLRRHLIDFRKVLIQRLAKAGLAERERAVAGALILGDRAEIDQEVIADFTASGLVHILAVSGMHVGLIYGAWILLLAWLLPKGRRDWAIFTALPLIWVYAILTGLSPSVLRATVMYSLIAIASMRKTPASPFNALAGAALLMLVYDPSVLKQAGFQLSFIAVWGILTVEPILNRCRAIRLRVWRMVAISALVTFAAQMATAPFGFYHFGSFPVYFFIANLLAIPLATILTYWGIWSIIAAPIPVVGPACVWLLEKGIFLLNSLAAWVQQLPFSSISGAYFTLPELFAALVLLMAIALMIYRPSILTVRKALYAALGLSILLGATDLIRLYKPKYIAYRKRASLELCFVRKGQITHVTVGKAMQLAAHQEIGIALGKEFRQSKCQTHYIFNNTRWAFKPIKQSSSSTWKDYIVER